MFSKFAKIVKKLSSPSELKRKEAMDEIFELKVEKIGIHHLEYLIHSSGEVYKDDADNLKDGSSALMEFVSRYESEEFILLMEKAFPKMSVWARSITLTVLTRMKTEESLKAFLRILDDHIDVLNIIEFQIALSGKDKECADILFPDILDYVEYQNISYTINRYIWSCLEHGTITSEDISGVLPTLINEYDYLAHSLHKHQDKLSNELIWSDGYQDLRNEASLLLDLFGFVKSIEAKVILKEALSYKDVRLKFFAAVSLTRHGIAMEDALIQEIAENVEMRNFLYKFLSDEKQQDRFPKKFATQPAFAASNLVNWLSYPTELGHCPTEIELMEVITRNHEELGELDYYVYRFRSEIGDWKENGWMAGITGYYIKDGPPSLIGNGYTYSLFEPWEKWSAEEHFEIITNTINEFQV